MQKNEEIKDGDLIDLFHELLIGLKIKKSATETKVLRKIKTEISVLSLVTKVIKSDIKQPSLLMNTSLNKFPKFLSDCRIYKTDIKDIRQNANKLLYSACDEVLQSNIINGLPQFLTVLEMN